MLEDVFLGNDETITFDRSSRFFPGRIVATDSVMEELQKAGLSPWLLLNCHLRADWGDLDDSDCRENDRSLARGGRLHSSYSVIRGSALTRGITVWIVTEADRSATTLMLPDDY